MSLPSPFRLNHFFESSAARVPHSACVITGERTWTYVEVDAEANRLARRLAAREGVMPRHRVAIMLKPGLDAYLATLAILKCGATFVPLDPSFPDERVEFIRADAGVFLFMDEVRFANLRNDRAEDIALPVQQDHDEEDLAYIIYTSGTSGKPKGVGITHSNISNFLRVVPSIYGVGSSDRVYQGMTPSFDFSLEEVWPTWIAGAALVPPPNGERLIGDELHEFLNRRCVTMMYVVPTLLATISDELPDLHTINVGGEACPRELVTRWSRPGRRILNTYGPTETTITASWAELSADRAVTIGKPLPTYSIRLLDDDLNPVIDGTGGEICIAGPGVAPGYINRPELTAEKFVILDGQRFYRTGDLGRLGEHGEIEFLGRIDTQVKIRGYRIELGEIESILTDRPQVSNAIVAPFTGADGVTMLVGYLLLSPSATLDASMRQEILEQLQTALPAYMIPAHLEVMGSIPTLASGKADRSKLPPPESPRLLSHVGEFVPPEGETELALAEVWCAAFKLAGVSATAHFFFDLGGDSLLVATTVSRLRQQPHFTGLSVSEIYKQPTIRQLASHLDAREPFVETATEREIRRASWWQVSLAGCVQIAAVYVLLIFFSESLTDVLHVDRITNWMLMAGAYILLSAFVWLIMPIAIKWIVIGRFKPGRYPLWGSYFLRWWTVRTALRFVPMDYLAGTPVMRLYLRMMGAKIGSGCYIGSKNLLLPDLVSVGEGAHIGYNVDILAHEIRDGWLILEPIHIGADSYIGANSIVFLGSTVEDGALLGEQSLVPRGGTILAGEYWQGSPAQQMPMPDTLKQLHALGRRQGVPLTAGPTSAYLLSAVVLYLLMFASQAPCVALLEGPMRHHDWLAALAWLIPGAVANILFSCLLIAGAKWLVLPRMKEGVYPVHSVIAWRKWFSDKLVSTSLDVIYSVYATIYTKYWLRALGVKAGKGSEISTLNYFDPNMLSLAPYSFIADQATLGAAVFHQGWFAVRETRVESRAFVGNCAHQSLGCHLEAGSLLGVLSHKHGEPLSADSSWLGSPALHLQRREVMKGYDDAVLYTPPFRIVCLRYAIEFFRITIPQMVLSAAFVATIMLQQDLSDSLPVALALVLSPLCFLGVGMAMTLFAAMMKWLLVGSYQPRMAPLWSMFVWRSEMATTIYENISLPLLLNWFTGSPVFNILLRLFGCHIGKRVYCDTTYVTEFDLVHIGDHAALAENINLQTHLFEDRIMKLSHVRVGEGSVVGQRAVVLYDTDLGKDSVLSPLSLVMKGESLPEKTVWRGIPAAMRDDLGKVSVIAMLACIWLGAERMQAAVVETMVDSGFSVARHEIFSSLSVIQDHSLGSGWHLLAGLIAERHDFGGGEAREPKTLQSLAIDIGLEYRAGDDAIFSLDLRPGFYGGSAAANSLFDVPVTLEGNVPLGDKWALALGARYERFSGTSLLPVIGVVGAPSEKWDIELVFPESKISYMPDTVSTYSLFAELQGNSYRLPSRQLVEFYGTRIGMAYERKLTSQLSVKVESGWLLDQNFDYYRETLTVHVNDTPFVDVGLSWGW